MMQELASIGLSNAAVAALMAVAVFAVTRCWRSPPLAHALWLLVLLKFLSPPLVGVALRLPVADSPTTPSADTATMPRFEDFTAMPDGEPGSLPDELSEQRDRQSNGWELSDGELSDGELEDSELTDGELSGNAQADRERNPPEPPQASDQFDPWVGLTPPTGADLSGRRDAANEAIASAPVDSFQVPLADGDEQDDATTSTEPPLEFDPFINVEIAEPRVEQVDRPVVGSTLNFTAIWPYAFGVWLAGAAIWFAAVGVRMKRFGRLLKRTDAAPNWLCEEVAELARQISLRTVPAVRLVDAVMPPLAWAMFGRPLLLLPRELVERLDADERWTLLAHELAHLRRRDHLTRWLEILVLGLYWWQPVAWFARRQLHGAAEQCCDAWVVRRFPEHARAYAQALFKTVEFLADADTAMPVGATGFSQVHLLERRFAMILQGRRTDCLSRAVRYGLLLLGLVILPLSIRSLWADEPTRADPVPASAPETEAAKPQAETLPATTAPATIAPAAPTPAATPALPATPPAAATAPTPAAPPSLNLLPRTAPLQPQTAFPMAPLVPPSLPPESAFPTPNPPTLAPRSKPTRAVDPTNLDDRLSRLEDTVEALVRELRARPVSPSGPTYYSAPTDRYSTPPSIPNAVQPDSYTPQSIPNTAPYNQATPQYRPAPKSRSSRSSPRAQTAPMVEEQREIPSSEPAIGPLEEAVKPVPPTPAPALSDRAAAASRRNSELHEVRDKALLQDQELEAANVFANLQREFESCKQKQESYAAAEKNLEEVQSAYSKGATTLDLLLDAQRRATEKEIEFAQSLHDVTRSQSSAVGSTRALALTKLRSLNVASNRAKKTWRDVKALHDQKAPGGEAEKEAQAREQYFRFRGEVEKALSDYYNAEPSGPRYE